MTPEYARFLASKAPVPPSAGIEPATLPAHLFDFQRDAVTFCLRKGRAALFLDTGLGKTRAQLEWCRQTAAASNGRALILTPLAVARQIEAEGLSLGYQMRVIREASDVSDGINVCNYDRLDKLDPRAFGAVSLDESSVLKSFTGATTRALIERFAGTRFKLCATATPAPNDHMELGQHAEFLGIMTRAEMLVRWFINDSSDTGTWRLKGHAERKFWDWVTSWAVMAETPADLGYDASRFVLPELRVHRHKAVGDVRAPAGSLFVEDLSATNIHAIKRQTAEARADVVAGLVRAEPDQAWLAWCDSDYEADALLGRLPEAADLRGSLSLERKEQALAAFLAGEVRTLVTKPAIAGAGLNLQFCARMAFVGRGFSYEQWYQAVRRCWRFGQSRPVDVHLIVAEGEDQIGRVIARKADDHARMKDAMRAATRRAAGISSAVKVPYNPKHQGEMPAWLLSA